MEKTKDSFKKWKNGEEYYVVIMTDSDKNVLQRTDENDKKS